MKIPTAVWNEITLIKTTSYYNSIESYFEDKVEQVTSFNELSSFMDYGESEALTLYKETNADFLLIDDKKARNIAESLDINCIGTLGLSGIAKEKRIINELRPLFEELLQNNRYFSLTLLNGILENFKEAKIEMI